MRALPVLSIVSVAWLLWMVVLYSDAGTGFITWMKLIYPAVALVIAWIVIWFVVRHRSREDSALPRPHRLVWLITPSCILAAIALTMLPPKNALFMLRFRLSETALHSAARRMLADKHRHVPYRQRLGLFGVQRMVSYDSQVRFITTSCGVVDVCGIVYAPSGLPRRMHEDRYTHLRGPWWHLYEGF